MYRAKREDNVAVISHNNVFLTVLLTKKYLKTLLKEKAIF